MPSSACCCIISRGRVISAAARAELEYSSLRDESNHNDDIGELEHELPEKRMNV